MKLEVKYRKRGGMFTNESLREETNVWNYFYIHRIIEIEESAMRKILKVDKHQNNRS